MSENKMATKEDLKEMYNRIYPYLGGLTTSKAGFTPIGTIISVMGTTAPVNYLACDGTVYNIADYTELANYFYEQFGSKNFFGGDGTTTFAVPDLRGEFLRGTGTNSHENQGSGASVGVHQDATDQIHWVRYEDHHYVGARDNNITEQHTDSKHNGNFTVTGRTFIDTDNKDTFITDKLFYTARPTNTSVLYCIATKNFYIDPTLDYSTDEKVVGTWIDGSPVYQKVVYNTTLATIPNNSWVQYCSITNLKAVISFSLIRASSDGAPSNGVFNDISGSSNGNSVKCIARESTLTLDNSKSYAIIQYTKTT